MEWWHNIDSGYDVAFRRKKFYYNYNSRNMEGADSIQATINPNAQGTWAFARANNSNHYPFMCFAFKRLEVDPCPRNMNHGIDKECNILLLLSVKSDGTLQKLTS